MNMDYMQLILGLIITHKLSLNMIRGRTKRHGWVISTPASYSRGHGLDSWALNRQTLPRFFQAKAP
jgi:hypothetical protein